MLNLTNGPKIYRSNKIIVVIIEASHKSKYALVTGVQITVSVGLNCESPTNRDSG